MSDDSTAGAQPRHSILPTATSFGHNVRLVNRLIQRDLSQRIAPIGLTIGQWYALRALWEADGLTQAELASRSGINGPAMVAAVRSLLAAGLVTRRRPKGDRRKYLIELTESGRRIEEQALGAANSANQFALGGIPAEEVAVCMKVLRAALANLEAFEAQPGRLDAVRK